MFQVAAHPTAFDRHAHSHHRQASFVHSTSDVKLPRTLARPDFIEVSNQALLAVSADLVNVPPEYIRRGLLPKVNEMFAGISALAPSHLPTNLPRSHLPPALSIPLRATSIAHPSYPTHVLAVSSSKSHSEQASVLPVHAVVLATHCALLPPLPPSHQAPHAHTLNLPVLPLSLPSPPAFHILHQFMYTHRPDAVLRSLFPLPSAFLKALTYDTVRSTLGSGSALHHLSSYLCSSASGNLQTLTTHAAHVKDVWQDMVALGMYDPELWDTIDLAWEIVLGALNLAAAGQ